MTQQPMGSDWEYVDDEAAQAPPRGATAPDPVNDAMQPRTSSGEMSVYGDAVKASNDALPPASDAIRTEAKKRVKQRIAFKHRLNSFIGVNAMLWVIWLISAFSSGWMFPWPLWVTVFWGLGMFNQWRSLRNPGPSQVEIDAQIEAEARRLRGEA